MAIGGAAYRMGRPPSGIDPAVARYLVEELQKIVRSLQAVENIQLAELNATPSKTQEGLVVLADGTNFNPGGGGQGVYAFYNNTFNKLG